jgi:hypothetical protein
MTEINYIQNNEFDPLNEDISDVLNKFVCDICDLKYATYAGLYSHRRRHDPDYIPKFSCSECDYKHDNIYHLKGHIKTHNNNNVDAQIITNQRKLYRKNNIYRQMYNEDEKTFSCNICNKKYQYRQSLQVHIKTHDDFQTFKFNCENCNFKCNHKAQFSRHTINCKF